MKRHTLTLLALLSIILYSCTSRPDHPTVINQLPAIYPDYVEVTVPVGIAPLDFAMADDAFTTIDVTVKGSNGDEIHANGAYADFDIDDWHALLEANRGGQLTVTVCAEQGGNWTQYQDFVIHVSQHALDEWGITYRLIPPSYEIYSKMGLYQRDLSNFDESAMLVNTQSPGMCINCHTANRTDPETYLFHVRGPHGATVIHRQGQDELLKAKNEVLGGSMVYPYWHPGGRYCAFSTNATAQIFHIDKNKRIEVYDDKSDIFVYDTETHTILNDTLTMTPDWAENCPAFSPDGKWLYFITATQQSDPTGYDKEMYSLCRVAFDDTTGRIGHQVDTLINTRQTGKSATWPRPTYDGRYLMYTQADYGYFTVWHPEADLWLLDLESSETRPLDEVNSDRAESFHNWSVNSHWFLFTSRRDDGLYTRIYLAAFEDGKATKPFMLPQRNPKTYYRRQMYSYNTPDFTVQPVDAHPRSMGQAIESDERISATTMKMDK